ncbi:uncharacterized protein LOC125675635 [Ostrea edulis]|uniref:uncharacterized protein LOC125675635 n=1 Tax=Ostrea edulis TaxID=37623 RepID=UPI0024AF8C67|nr:uncharacterized protein LOC125675635 [Ostrea edulis]
MILDLKLIGLILKMDSPIFDIAGDNKQEMREFVGRKKILKTIERIEIIKEKHAGVNMFLPPWATDAYFESLHKQETKEHFGREAGENRLDTEKDSPQRHIASQTDKDDEQIHVATELAINKGTKNFHVQENRPEDDSEDDNEDDTEDDNEEPLPWKLFLFNINTLKIPIQDRERYTTEELEDVTEPSLPGSSLVNNAKPVPKPKKRGLGRRLLKFLGVK